MKIGVFTVSMPEYSPKEAVKLLKELGYDGVEWRVAQIEEEDRGDIRFEERYWHGNKCTLDIEKIEDEAESIKNLCEKADISILSLTTYLRPHESSRIEKVLKAARAIGCGQVRVFTPEYNETENYEEVFARTVEHVKTLEKLAQKYDTKIVFEIHMDNILASASAAQRMLSGFDPRYVGVIFDPGNMVFEGFENYKKCFEMLGDYIAHVHIKNGKIEPVGEDEKGVVQWKRTWTPIRKGSADLKKLIRVMKEMNYEGNISVEDFSNEENTYEKLKHNLEYLRELTAGGDL